LDLDQLVSVLASDDPLKLGPDMAADSMGTDGFPGAGLEAGGVSPEEAGVAAFLAEANAAPLREDRMTAFNSATSVEEAAEAGVEAGVPSVARMFSDALETASVSTADVESVETASNAGSDATGSDATGSMSDALEVADGWSTPPVPPSPTLAGALPFASPACKHVRCPRPSGVMMDSEATSFKVLGERPETDKEHVSQEVLAASPSAAFDKSELLELLSKHYPATPDGPDGELRDAMSSAKRSLLRVDDAAVADEGLAKRLRGGAVRA